MTTSKGSGAKGRLAALFTGHPVAAGAGAALLAFGCLVLILWFTVFSGLSSSAEFVYNQF